MQKKKIEEENSYRSALNRRDDDDDAADRRFLVVLAQPGRRCCGAQISTIKQIQLEQQQQRQQRLPKMCILCQKTKNPTVFSLPPLLHPISRSIRSSHQYLSSLVRIYLDFVHTSSEKATKIYIMEYKWTDGRCWMDTRVLEEHDVTSFGRPISAVRYIYRIGEFSWPLFSVRVRWQGNHTKLNMNILRVGRTSNIRWVVGFFYFITLTLSLSLPQSLSYFHRQRGALQRMANTYFDGHHYFRALSVCTIFCSIQ